MKLKKLVSLLFAVTMISSLSACGSKENEEINNSAIATETVAVQEEMEEVTEKDIVATEKNEEDDDFESIVEKDVENIISDLTNEYEELVSEIDTYDKYIDGVDKIEAYYLKLINTTSDLRIKLSEYALNYAQEIISSDMSNDDKYDELDEIHDVIYEDARDIIYDEIYDGIRDEMYDTYYDGILSDAFDDDNISYSELSDVRSNEYDMWSDTGSEIYDIWSDCGSDIYDFRSDVKGEIWDDDLEKAQKKIDDFKEDIEKLKSGNKKIEKAENELSDSKADDNKEIDISESEKIRPEFKEALDSYEAFFDEYCEFMKKYSESPDDLSLLEDYADYMQQYSETMEKISELETEDMNDAELKYYLEVTNRINEKLLNVAL